jgi:secondary thiamine-phosphate synthase enzyme
MKSFKVSTNSKSCMINITSQVRKLLLESGVSNGLCFVFIPHTTAAVTINENADPSVVKDILKDMDRIVPYNNKFLHMEGNSDAHIKSSLFGFSETLIIENNDLLLGIWQGIYFCEFDGPRTRTVYVKFMEG